MRLTVKIFLLMTIVVELVAQERPVIGISDTFKDGQSAVPRTYVEAVLSADGIPVVVPLMREDKKIVELLKTLDGIIFTGGEDFDPDYYNERPIPQMGRINAPRDTFDIRLLRLAVENGVPVLGICRGVQLINVAFGGSLYQDLKAQYPNKSISHAQKQEKTIPTHQVVAEAGTVFSDIVGERVFSVNSAHHQAVKRLAPGFKVAGKSTDGVIEAIEWIDSSHWILGVQFHPEILFKRDYLMRKLFTRFVGEALHVKAKRPDNQIIYMASSDKQEYEQPEPKSKKTDETLAQKKETTSLAANPIELKRDSLKSIKPDPRYGID